MASPQLAHVPEELRRRSKGVKVDKADTLGGVVKDTLVVETEEKSRKTYGKTPDGKGIASVS